LREKDVTSQVLELETTLREMPAESVEEGRRKSVFHNFQKHTITLLKKCCRFGTNTFKGLEHGQVAAALWQTFIKIKSCNKKVFNIIFGFPSNCQLER
jgi:hypothetical protein